MALEFHGSSQRINIHDFTISDAVCATINRTGLETNIYSDWFFANYQLLYTNQSRDPSSLFLNAKLIVHIYSTIHTIRTTIRSTHHHDRPGVRISVAVFFNSSRSLFLKKPRKLLPDKPIPSFSSHSFCSLSHRSSFHINHSFGLC